jgi:hypothetical protein
LPDISPDGRLSDRVFRVLGFQARPDPMRRVPLLFRCFQIQQQYLLDLVLDRAESRLISRWSLPHRRNRRADRLPDHSPVNAVLRSQTLYRLSGCMSSPDLFK